MNFPAAIFAAEKELHRAKINLQAVVAETYPVGTSCRFWRSPRVLPATVVVVSHTDTTKLTVRNEETNKVYKVDGTSRRLRKVTA